MATTESTTVPIKEAAARFLDCRRIAVTGVSRHPKGEGSNAVYCRLRDRGYDVVAVNPNADEVEGDPCFHSLREVPDGVEAVVIGTRPEDAEATVQECIDLGIDQVWMHRSVGGGSVCDEATVLGRENGVTVIDGGCPLMFGPTSDGMHKVMRLVFTSHVPKRVPVTS
jgi:predicted CoA-binding protein